MPGKTANAGGLLLSAFSSALQRDRQLAQMLFCAEKQRTTC
jgi:glutamate dehydrogenase/leucine dehydrogenase